MWENTRILGKTHQLKQEPEEGFVAISPANLLTVISLIAPLLKQKKR